MRDIFSIGNAPTLVLAALLTIFLTAPATLFAQDQEEMRGAPAEPADASEIRAQMAVAENLLGKTPDRGAIFYFLAASKASLGEILPAIQDLQKCVAFKEGFDPSGDSAFAAIKTSSDFRRIVEQVHKDFPPVNESHVAFTSVEKDIFPEGLEYDPGNDTLYMSSMYHPKVLKVGHDGKIDVFVPPARDHLLPVFGIRISPSDGTIWSASADEDSGKSELLHFDRGGALLGRYPPAGNGKHTFNDLVVLRDGSVFLTDSLANAVYRFRAQDNSFTPLRVARSLLSPNGIALTEDETALYVADLLGVLRIDLKTGASVDVDPGAHNTVAGIDGLYWHKGSLVAVQNGIGTPRVVEFQLAADGLHVVKTTVFANSLTTPTTGALRGDDFYFIANGQGDNLNGSHIMDVTRLQLVKIAVVHLP